MRVLILGIVAIFAIWTCECEELKANLAQFNELLAPSESGGHADVKVSRVEALMYYSLLDSLSFRASVNTTSHYSTNKLLTFYSDKYPREVRPKCTEGRMSAKELSKKFVNTHSLSPDLPSNIKKRWGRDGSNCPNERWLQVWAELELLNGLTRHYERGVAQQTGAILSSSSSTSSSHPERATDKETDSDSPISTSTSTSSTMRPLLFVNVGFNKGYNFAIWASLFAPTTGINTQRWHQLLLEHTPTLRAEGSKGREEGVDKEQASRVACGWDACRDCEAVYKLNSTLLHGSLDGSAGGSGCKMGVYAGQQLTMLGVDLNRQNLLLAERVVKGVQFVSATKAIETNPDSDSNQNTAITSSSSSDMTAAGISLYTTHAAVSDAAGVGVMKLPKCPVADEECSIAKLSPKIDEQAIEYEEVPVRTVDEIMTAFFRFQSQSQSRSHTHSASSTIDTGTDTDKHSGKKDAKEYVETEIGKEVREAALATKAREAAIATKATGATEEIKEKEETGAKEGNLRAEAGRAMSLQGQGKGSENGRRLGGSNHDRRPPHHSNSNSNSKTNSKRRERVSERSKGHKDHKEHAARKTRSHGPRVDVLMLDTEGNDPKVISGSELLLKNKDVRALLFEYHRNGQWETVKLRGVVEQVAQYGYDCYWQGQARLWPITGCWHDNYEFHNWSNVICLLREDPWHAAVQHLVVSTEREE